MCRFGKTKKAFIAFKELLKEHEEDGQYDVKVFMAPAQVTIDIKTNY